MNRSLVGSPTPHAVGVLALTVLVLLLAGLPPVPSASGKPWPEPPPRARQGRTPTLDVVPIADGTARVTGGARQRRVTVQARWGGKWKRVAKVRVRHGRFATKVALRATRAGQVRVVAGRWRSRPKTLPRVLAGQIWQSGAAAGGAEQATGPSDACGPQPRRADGTYWSCTFVDDFSGADLDRTRWAPQTVFSSGDKLGRYACYRDHPDNISVSGGALHLTLRREDKPILCLRNGLLPTPYSSGMVSTHRLFSQRYGRFEARYANTGTVVPGLQETFWLWPDDRYQKPLDLWPAAGEIDVAETYSQHPDLAIPFLHYTRNDNGGPVPGRNTAWNCRALRGGYNTYTLEWTPTRLEILVNGTSCLVNTSGDQAFQKPYIVALTMLLGASGNKASDATPMPATMSIDYVRAWQ
ncbi:glycoside hydrolase family 16 protein [Nocardioides sp. LHD-245]|uniref:glycoside hydrolase family 16 protein n=1 Tax=Nocardioides sp. LHD-245 TaxID=3051387 RepID=UPI0027DF5809|nr:glycoside hydrolase family 16 protein [Nocardioides sp. LHD-245]